MVFGLEIIGSQQQRYLADDTSVVRRMKKHIAGLQCVFRIVLRHLHPASIFGTDGKLVVIEIHRAYKFQRGGILNGEVRYRRAWGQTQHRLGGSIHTHHTLRHHSHRGARIDFELGAFGRVNIDLQRYGVSYHYSMHILDRLHPYLRHHGAAECQSRHQRQESFVFHSSIIIIVIIHLQLPVPPHEP